MTVEITYVALKPLRVGGQRREIGELVPEASEWPRASAWISQGRIAAVAKGAIDPEKLRQAEIRWKGEPEVVDETTQEDDELVTFSTGTGWYEIPGADKKMRRDEAAAYLASLEDGSEE